MHNENLEPNCRTGNSISLIFSYVGHLACAIFRKFADYSAFPQLSGALSAANSVARGKCREHFAGVPRSKDLRDSPKLARRGWPLTTPNMLSQCLPNQWQ